MLLFLMSRWTARVAFCLFIKTKCKENRDIKGSMGIFYNNAFIVECYGNLKRHFGKEK